MAREYRFAETPRGSSPGDQPFGPEHHHRDQEDAEDHPPPVGQELPGGEAGELGQAQDLGQEGEQQRAEQRAERRLGAADQHI